ncbi:MAG: hypothetical protein MJZ20_09475 [Bacteroidaceae bacterium]|nr:hypothetical protein [Bacteroidaceae bacterium]
MSKQGGYLIIDFKGKSLSDVKTVIDGIYDRIEGNKGKAMLLSGLVLGGVEKPDAFATYKVDSGNFVFTVYGYDITITDDDEITIAEAQSGGGSKLYSHNMVLKFKSGTATVGAGSNIVCNIINKNSNTETIDSIKEFMTDNSITYINATGKIEITFATATKLCSAATIYRNGDKIYLGVFYDKDNDDLKYSAE